MVLSNKRGLNPELCAWCAKRTHGRTEKATLTPNVTQQASTQLSGQLPLLSGVGPDCSPQPAGLRSGELPGSEESGP